MRSLQRFVDFPTQRHAKPQTLRTPRGHGATAHTREKARSPRTPGLLFLQ
ncbi:hypothetical protein SCATT_40570 [Streptantibioticus cattleyicolor NRRL 8057 = DSM 46488]|uniref:Uncharacterized protein n=1 Tax=Streptantibioticus cattleyicolor (strain ATCC 35852 / DSM 46488 / JCM 4925 / NBRC 14057 / NRRL 8057) TaxID=1003195 RepID=G8WXB7_STREN|nr:hypothetical protein SCATT_40570 [Streptantibioticus cattleyicolor NRRL 8057 = DSM 46488]